MASCDAGQRPKPDDGASTPPVALAGGHPGRRAGHRADSQLAAVWAALSAGVALYVAATDLVPEVNREPGIRMALVFFAGVAGFLVLRMILPAL